MGTVVGMGWIRGGDGDRDGVGTVIEIGWIRGGDGNRDGVD